MPANSNNFEHNLAEIASKFANQLTQPWILIKTATQTLYILENFTSTCQYTISTSKFGNGCEQDSLQTPVGAHFIAQRIGGDEQLGEIFEGRQATGAIAEIIQEQEASELDLILSRILWLQGLEENKNSGDGCDSFHRYIYIHGTHEEGLLGAPASHGCVRMSNVDVIELYNRVAEGTFVYID